jgi:hypothetical protein
MEFLPELKRQFVRLTLFVEGDGFPNVIHDHLAGIAAGHMLLELLADGRIHGAIHVFIEHLQEVFAFHRPLLELELTRREKLQTKMALK